MECYILPLPQSHLFPTITKPLNIFETAYLQLIHEAIQNKKPIAICYTPDRQIQTDSIAGYGFPQIIEQRPDGSLLLFVTGAGKIRIRKILSALENPYCVAEVEILKEDYEVDSSLTKEMKLLNAVLAQWIDKHIHENQQKELFLKSLKGPIEIVSAMSSYLVRDYDLQNELMQVLNINDQIRLIYRLIESKELTF